MVFILGLLVLSVTFIWGISFAFFPVLSIAYHAWLSDKLGTPFYGDEFHDEFYNKYKTIRQNPKAYQEAHPITIITIRLTGLFFIIFDVLAVKSLL